MTYAAHLALNGGMATCGEHLGVFVGEDEGRCPPGWVFVEKGSATEELVQEALEVAKGGRGSWPESAK